MNNKIVFTAGTFDLFHVGHLNILMKSKSLGNKLIVGINSDKLVLKYKNKKPLMPYKLRKKMIESCIYVDEVIKIDKLLDINIMKNLKMNILTIGDDWKGKYLEGLEWAKNNPEINLIYIPYTKEINSTKIRRLIRNEKIRK